MTPRQMEKIKEIIAERAGLNFYNNGFNERQVDQDLEVRVEFTYDESIYRIMNYYININVTYRGHGYVKTVEIDTRIVERFDQELREIVVRSVDDCCNHLINDLNEIRVINERVPLTLSGHTLEDILNEYNRKNKKEILFESNLIKIELLMGSEVIAAGQHWKNCLKNEGHRIKYNSKIIAIYRKEEIQRNWRKWAICSFKRNKEEIMGPGNTEITDEEYHQIKKLIYVNNLEGRIY